MSWQQTTAVSLVSFLIHPPDPPASPHGADAGPRVGERVGEDKRPTKAPPPRTAAAVREARSAAEAEAAEVETTSGIPEAASAASESDPRGAVGATAKQTRTTTVTRPVGDNRAVADVTKARAAGGIATVAVAVTVTVILTEVGIAVVPATTVTTTSDRGTEKGSGAAAAAAVERGATVGRYLPGPASRPSPHGRAGRTKVVGAVKAERDQLAPLPGETGSKQGTEAGVPSSTRGRSPG